MSHFSHILPILCSPKRIPSFELCWTYCDCQLTTVVLCFCKPGRHPNESKYLDLRKTRCCCLPSVLESKICSFDSTRYECGWKTILAGIQGISDVWEGSIAMTWLSHINDDFTLELPKKNYYGKPLGYLNWTAPAKWICSWHAHMAISWGTQYFLRSTSCTRLRPMPQILMAILVIT